MPTGEVENTNKLAGGVVQKFQKYFFQSFKNRQNEKNVYFLRGGCKNSKKECQTYKNL